MPKVGPYIYPNTEEGKAKAAAKAEAIGKAEPESKVEAPKVKRKKEAK